MARSGKGYGSEYHLNLYLRYNREGLNTAVCDKIGADALHFDCPFQPIRPNQKAPEQGSGAEWRSLDFLPKDSAVVRKEWCNRWPHRGNVMNWDAVGEVEISGQREWLLIEAKAHTGEIKTYCRAKSDKSIKCITQVFDKTKEALGVASDAKWMKPYYQYANRLAVLHHLSQHNIGAHLLFIYFCGDRRPDGETCPKDESGWRGALAEQDRHIGLPEEHELSRRIHKLSLPVWFDSARA